MELIQHTMPLDKKIFKLTKTYNYLKGDKVLTILSNLNEEDTEVVFNEEKVKKALLSINNTELLRKIFRNSSVHVQEKIFEIEELQEKLLIPHITLSYSAIKDNYNKKDFYFNNKEVREFETFLHTIKSEKIRNEIIDNKVFKILIPLFKEEQLRRTSFKNIDGVKLFYNIISDPELYSTTTKRKLNIIKIFNKTTNHILLPEDYKLILKDENKFISDIRYKRYNEEKIYVDDKTFTLLTTPMIKELFRYDNIDKEFIKEKLSNDIQDKMIKYNYDFNKIFSNLLTGDYDCFNDIDFIYFTEIINNIEKNDVIKNNFIDFLYKILITNNNSNLKEETLIKESIYRKLINGNINKKEYSNLFYEPNILKSIFFLKFGKISRRMDYLNGISVKQLMYVNIKHINQIIKALDIQNEDEMSNTYSYAIKMYMVFGLERALKILKGDFGGMNRHFLDNVSRLNVKNIKLINEGSKYLPEIDNRFINFMFETPKNNHFIDMFSEPSSLLNKNWSYLYNNFDNIKDKCHGNITLKKVNIILHELSPDKEVEITPNNFKLEENDILDDIFLGNKSRKSNKEVFNTVVNIYDQMKMRYESSIPYVKGEENGYSYEMMKLKDPIAFTLGYKAKCCIRTHDIAHKHLLHATLCRNGRILILYDKFKNVAGFVPLKRNGNVLIANSIECADKTANNDLINIFEKAIKDIIDISQANEKEPIKLVCIGRGSYVKPNGTPFPKNYRVPTIYEKLDEVYANTDEYHHNLDIIYKDKNLDLSQIKYGDPEHSYKDPRPKIKIYDSKNSSSIERELALKNINSIAYENTDIFERDSFKKCNYFIIDKCIFNDDWYLILTKYNNVYGEFLKFDPRAEAEFKIAFKELMGKSYEEYYASEEKSKRLIKNI